MMIATRSSESKGCRRASKCEAVMDPEKTIAEIELLERMLTLPDKRPLKMPDWKAANQKHDEAYANDPWFRLWKRDGV